jgi:hypothetical protein
MRPGCHEGFKKLRSQFGMQNGWEDMREDGRKLGRRKAVRRL